MKFNFMKKQRPARGYTIRYRISKDVQREQRLGQNDFKDWVNMQIQRWVAISNTVTKVDFLSLATFFSMLPEKKLIVDSHILLKTMHECMTKTGSCIWHRTYGKIVKDVQRYMQIEYNSDLMVPPIRCDCFQV